MVALQVEFPKDSASCTKPRNNAEIRISRRRVTGKQLRFDWDSNDISETSQEKSTSQKQPTARSTSTPSTRLVKPEVTSTGTKSASSNHSSRIGEPTKLGLVMFRLLKRYGITDEEIIEGLQMSHAQAV